MSDELKPCPFCGNSAIVVEIGRGTAFRVKCRNILECGSETENFDTTEEATAAWNRRTPSDHIVAANKTADDNPPLTLEELRRMDGEPVRIIFYSKTSKCGVWNGWALVDLRFPAMEFLKHNLKFEYYGKSWLAYRRKPEED